MSIGQNSAPDKLASLTVREEAYVRRVFQGQDLIPAYRACFRCAGLSEQQILNSAKAVLVKPNVVVRLEQMINDAALISSIDKARVLQEIADVAFSSAADFVKLNRYCCRYCHGFENKYQWIDEKEFESSVARFNVNLAIYDQLDVVRKASTVKPVEPNDQGGYEFKKYLPPDPYCPECNGKGVDDLELVPIDKVPARSLKLFAGAKHGKYGIEYQFHSKTDHLRMLADAMGLFTKKVELSTPNGQPLNVNHQHSMAELSGMSTEELQTLQTLLLKSLGPKDNSVVDVVAKNARGADPSNVPMSDRSDE